MLLGTLALAATISGPDLSGLITARDYPGWAVALDVSGASTVDLVVDPSGKIVKCTLLASFGAADLGKGICPMIRGRVVAPARDAGGTPLHGAVRTILKFFLPGDRVARRIQRLDQSPDVTLTATGLPGGKKRAAADVVLLVDANGTATACEPATPKDDAAIVRIICAAQASLRAKPITDAQCRPVASVIRKKVELVSAQ